MFSTTLKDGLYLDSTGLAEARMEVRALSVAIIPALAMLTVCCSIASWRMARVVPDILSCEEGTKHGSDEICITNHQGVKKLWGQIGRKTHKFVNATNSKIGQDQGT